MHVQFIKILQCQTFAPYSKKLKYFYPIKAINPDKFETLAASTLKYLHDMLKCLGVIFIKFCL